MIADDDLPRSCEVVVIGGGIVGAACADALARAGAEIVLIEQRQLASGASGACEGDVLLSDKEPGAELELGRLGQAIYDELEERLATDIHVERKGALVLHREGVDVAAVTAYVDRMRAAGVKAEVVNSKEVRHLEPALSSDVVVGAFFPDDLQVWPMKVVIGLALSAALAGAKIVSGTRVDEITITNDSVTGVRTSRGPVSCNAVVMAAGVGSIPLLKQCGVHLPLEGRKGQIVVTEPRPGLIRRKLFDGSYAGTVHSTRSGLQISTVLETTHRGNVLIGSSRDRSDLDDRARISVSAAMVKQAIKFVPELRHLGVIRTYAGFRPYLPDALPAIGRTTAVSGLILATGHEGSGINTGPVTGELVARIYTGKPLDIDLAAFNPDRFSEVGPSGCAGDAA